MKQARADRELYRSLRYLRIDIGLEPKEIVAISEEVILRNEHLRAAAGDGWLAQRVSTLRLRLRGRLASRGRLVRLLGWLRLALLSLLQTGTRNQ